MGGAKRNLWCTQDYDDLRPSSWVKILPDVFIMNNNRDNPVFGTEEEFDAIQLKERIEARDNYLSMDDKTWCQPETKYVVSTHMGGIDETEEVFNECQASHKANARVSADYAPYMKYRKEAVRRILEWQKNNRLEFYADKEFDWQMADEEFEYLQPFKVWSCNATVGFHCPKEGIYKVKVME